jgi:GTP-binding protein
LKLLSAEFVTSAAAALSRIDGPQVALAGRSNVGKSSLINALCRRTVARTSAAPGKTRLANVYRVTTEDGRSGRSSVYLVDLPGYGYARGGTSAADELRATAEGYLTGAPAAPARQDRSDPGGGEDSGRSSRRAPRPDAVLLLVDSRHPGLDSDVAAAAWLDGLGLTRHIVATKIDKLSRAERARNLRTLEETFGTAVVPVSATSGEGLDELWRLIARTRT